MWATIAKWAASKIVVIAVIVLALAGVIFTPVAIYQAFEINGYQILWWGAPGLKAKLATAQSDLKLSRDNTSMLKGGLDQCNASVLDLKAKGNKATAESQKRIAALEGDNKKLAANIAAMKAIRSTGEKCPVADQIMRRPFQ